MLTKDLSAPLDDLKDLDAEQLENLQSWEDRFLEKYLVVGKLVAEGDPEAPKSWPRSKRTGRVHISEGVYDNGRYLAFTGTSMSLENTKDMWFNFQHQFKAGATGSRIYLQYYFRSPECNPTGQCSAASIGTVKGYT
jgi:hypothetical protein